MTNRSMPRLSEVARYLIIPSGIKTDGWPAVEKKLERMGVVFDSWQVGATRLILGKREDETFAATIGGIFLSIPRQVGKTYMISSLIFALCLLTPNLTVVWTAHLLKTAGQTLRVWRSISKRKYVRPFVAQIRVGSGDWKVIFANGSTITLSAREGDQGRGESEVDVVVFDEAQILSDRGVDALVPTANASKQKSGALVIYMGTPPKPTDDSEVFTRNRTAALSGTADDMLYIEFSADPKTDPKAWQPGYVDFEAVAAANPSYPIHTPKVSVLRMARQLSRESLRREGLGIWDDVSGRSRLITATQWTALGAKEPPTDGVKSFGVAFSMDGKRVSVAGAMRHDGGVHVELVGAHSGSSEAGIASLADWLAGRWRTSATIVISGQAGAGVLHEALRSRGVPDKVLHIASTTDYYTSCAMFLSDATEVDPHLTHLATEGQKALDESVAACDKKARGQGGAWGWVATTTDGDETPIEAVSLANWGAKTSKRKPGRASRAVIS